MNGFMKRLLRLESEIQPCNSFWIMADGSEIPMTDSTDPIRMILGELPDFHPVGWRSETEDDPLTVSLYESAIHGPESPRPFSPKREEEPALTVPGKESTAPKTVSPYWYL